MTQTNPDPLRPLPSSTQRVQSAPIGEHVYSVGFYPGFVSCCRISTQAGETEIYRQEEPFRLGSGMNKPFSTHEITFTGGPHGQNLKLTIDDPLHRIARITVELYGDADVGSSLLEDTPTEVLQVENRAMLCPPMCY